MDPSNSTAVNNSSTCFCPICGAEMSKDIIEVHANKCLFLHQDTEDKSKEERKSFSIFDRSPNPVAKKPKLDTKGFGKSSQLSSKTSVDLTSNNKPFSTKSDEKFPLVDLTSIETKEHESLKPKLLDTVPLAEKVRPKSIDEFIGQLPILGPGSVLRKLFENSEIPSMILWGPPGCGKTSFSNIIEQKCKKSVTHRFVKTSAAAGSGVNDIKEIVKVAKNEAKFKRKTILFMDEIHRFNKAQQDVFLPHVENGTIVLIGATTENPSFALNSALLSRCRVIVLEKLKTEELIAILIRGLRVYDGICVDTDEPNLPNPEHLEFIPKLMVDKGTIKWLAEMSDGDARTALNSLQLAIQSVSVSEGPVQRLNIDQVKEGIKRSHMLYDRKGDQHYDMISALHKSIRASDDNAALYWVTRMMLGGEDPRYICRRLIRAASEDIGLADSNALNVAVNALQAVQLVGMPEADCIVAHCAVYLARSPKSTEVYHALKRCQESIKDCKGPLPPVPLHLRNAPTKLMKTLGYAEGYNTSHKDVSGLNYMPEGLEEVNYFD